MISKSKMIGIGIGLTVLIGSLMTMTTLSNGKVKGNGIVCDESFRECNVGEIEDEGGKSAEIHDGPLNLVKFDTDKSEHKCSYYGQYTKDEDGKPNPNGYGKFSCVNVRFPYGLTSIYIGEFKDGNFHGYGHYATYRSSAYFWFVPRLRSFYVGEWKDGKRNGKNGFEDDTERGDVYFGEWRADMRHGHGEMIYANGDRYFLGEWRDDMKKTGVMKIHNGEEFVVVGEYKNDQVHGEGFIKYEVAGDSLAFSGEWKEGKKWGKEEISIAIFHTHTLLRHAKNSVDAHMEKRERYRYEL